jgi:hypothetical protein
MPGFMTNAFVGKKAMNNDTPTQHDEYPTSKVNNLKNNNRIHDEKLLIGNSSTDLGK